MEWLGWLYFHFAKHFSFAVRGRDYKSTTTSEVFHRVKTQFIKSHRIYTHIYIYIYIYIYRSMVSKHASNYLHGLYGTASCSCNLHSTSTGVKALPSLPSLTSRHWLLQGKSHSYCEPRRSLWVFFRQKTFKSKYIYINLHLRYYIIYTEIYNRKCDKVWQTRPIKSCKKVIWNKIRNKFG